MSSRWAARSAMIRNSAKRFVEATRPTDRVAVVSFTDQPALYSTFTLDRTKLKKSIDEMDDAYGGTNFWDALDWVVRVLIPQGSTTIQSGDHIVVLSAPESHEQIHNLLTK